MRRVLAGGFGLAAMAAVLGVPSAAVADPQFPCGVSSYPIGDSYINVRFKNCTPKGMVVRPWDELTGPQGECKHVAGNGDWASWVGLPIGASDRKYDIVKCTD